MPGIIYGFLLLIRTFAVPLVSFGRKPQMLGSDKMKNDSKKRLMNAILCFTNTAKTHKTHFRLDLVLKSGQVQVEDCCNQQGYSTLSPVEMSWTNDWNVSKPEQSPPLILQFYIQDAQSQRNHNSALTVWLMFILYTSRYCKFQLCSYFLVL